MVKEYDSLIFLVEAKKKSRDIIKIKSGCEFNTSDMIRYVIKIRVETLERVAFGDLCKLDYYDLEELESIAYFTKFEKFTKSV